MASLELLSSKIIVKEEAPSIRNVAPQPSAVLFLPAITQKGPVRTPTLTTSFEEWVRIYGSYIASGQAALAVRQWFLNGGTQVWTSRVVHYTDITNNASKASVKATASFSTAAGGETAGEVICANTGPYLLDNGYTLDVRGSNDAVNFGPTTVLFSATAGAAVTNEAAAGAGGQEPFALANLDTLILAIDGGPNQTINFLTADFVDITNATAEEVAAVINGQLSGARATVTGAGTTVTITSDRKGTGSSVDVVGGTAAGAAKLDLTAGVGGAHTGTGHASNIAAATATEVVARIAAVLGGDAAVAVDANRIRIRSVGTGTDSNVKVDGGTANAAFGFDIATHTGFAGGAAASLQVDGKYDGTYANGFTVQILAATSGVTEEFNLVLRDAAGIILETWPNLSMVDTEARYVEKILNDASTGSIWIAVVDLDVARASQRPADTTQALSGGDDGLGAIADSDFVGDEAGQTGLRAFDTVSGGTLLICPDRATTAVQNAMITYAEVTRNFEMFCVLDSPAALSDTSVITHKQSLTASEHYALYWPRVKIPNPSVAVFGDGALLTVPPSGSLAGMFARSDASQRPGPFAQPAGVEVGRLFGVADLENDAVLRESVRDKIFPQRINPIIFRTNVGIFPDGARTGKGTGNFPSIGERRGASFVELSLKTGLEFAKNQANTEELRAAVQRTVRLFLLDQMSNGAFASQDPDEAFFLDVDVPGVGLNNASVQRAGQLRLRVGLATAAPAEFIILLVTRDTRALDEQAQGRQG